MIDLRRLHVLRMLAEHETVTATAAALHLTPSAVSQQLRLLARDVDAELLHHEGRRVRLTPSARLLLRHADALAAHWEQVRTELAGARGRVAGTVRFAGVSSAIAAFAAPAALWLRERYPDLGVHIREEESGTCYDLLLAGEADLGIVLPSTGAPPVTDPRFEQFTLADDPQDLLVPEGHRLALRGGVELAAASADPWVVRPHDNDSHSLLTVACTAAGFTPWIAQEAKEWFAVSALVDAGLGVCLLPRMVPIPATHAVHRIPLRGTPVPSRRIVVCLRRGSSGHPVSAAGIAALRAVASGAGSSGE